MNRPPPKGRGSAGNIADRFAAWTRETDADTPPDELPAPVTTLTWVDAKSMLRTQDSPDLRFMLTANPYQGCEHGCIYCYARPSHAYWSLSPGLDFETKLMAKRDAAGLLRKELSRPGYRCHEPICIGANTDAYQPIEREARVTRSLLEVLWEARHPVSLLTKGALITRDIDLLAKFAEHNLVQAFVSVTTLDPQLARRMEPRAASPARRLAVLAELKSAGIPTGILTAPVVPGLTDHETEHLLEAGHAAGVESAGYVVLRLPREVNPLFQDWLHQHYPDRAEHVMSLMRQMRGGQDYDSAFGQRMRGQGPLADLLSQRFKLACRRLGLNTRPRELEHSLFRPPRDDGQLSLL